MPSFLAVPTVSRTATSGQCNAIFAKCPAGEFQHVKTSAPLAGAVFFWFDWRLGIHTWEKPSARAMAFRMAMDLLTVSWNSASGVESFTQPPPACT